MPLPKLPRLSPLQSRLAASLIASAMLVLLYFTLSWPSFAYASEIEGVDSIRPEDHNHERLLQTPYLDLDYEDLSEFENLELRGEGGGLEYEAEFIGFDRGIIGRATNEPVSLINNVAITTNVPMGTLMSYMFTNASLWADRSPKTPGLPSPIQLQGRSLSTGSYEDEFEEDGDEEEEEDEEDEELRLRTRQSDASKERMLYITATTCSQPTSNASTGVPPQLVLYVSQSKNNTNPGPGQDSRSQTSMELTSGYALLELNATGDVFMGIYAKNDSSLSGTYSAQIAASIDAPYHYYWNSSDPNLFTVDSDSSSALLFTDPLITIAESSNTTLVEEWMDVTPPFQLFVNEGSSTSIAGLEHSYCGLQTNAQIVASRPGQTSSQVVTGMTKIGNGSLPKQQFYVSGLGASKIYTVALAMNGNSTASGDGVVGGGGQVFQRTSFSTLQGKSPPYHINNQTNPLRLKLPRDIRSLIL